MEGSFFVYAAKNNTNAAFAFTSLIDAVEDDAFIPVISPYLEQESVETMRKPKIVRRVDIADAGAWRSCIFFYTPKIN